ncbi:MAG: DUF799 domain-containing protein [Desulfuromonadales bacterium]|nr:DUF799 domain-containing protein [Desulfuromonadales bacterium]
MMKFIATITVLFLITGCAVVPPKDYTKFNAINPRSILIVPVVNNSAEVTAADYFLSTVTIPLAEQGYYVFPVNLVKRLLEDDGLSDADLVHSSPTERLANLFGSDAVLYVVINQWDAKYMVLSTQVTVDLNYVIKEATAGDTIWQHHQKMVYVPDNSSSGNPLADLIIMAISAAVTKAAPNYVPLARQANDLTFKYPGDGVPPGPYANKRNTTF